MEVKIKKLVSEAVLPTRGSEQAAGYDLYATSEFTVEPHKTVKVGTGLAVAIPEGYFGGIYPRSGLATKKGVRPANCVGVIDSDYRGEVIVACHNDSEETVILTKGERIAQLIVQPYLAVNFSEVDELDNTERGAGGFGSTGQ